jgi:TP901 family phage tail tape measure protein
MALETGGSLYWRTKIDNTGLQTGAVQAKGILRGLTRSITGMDVFAGLGIAAALVFSKITKEVYNFSRNFESAMKEVQTISKAVQNNFKGISKEIIDMSKTVPDNAQKLTKALYQIVSAGYDGGEAMDILRTSAELAVATVTDTFTAADALTYVMNAYGKAAGTAAEISDKLFTIVKLGKVKMEELGPTISMVTGLAAECGLGFSELAAMYAEAVKKIQPHIVSTGIRGILTAMLRVSKGTGDAADKARELGIEFDISALKSKGFKQILSEIIIATKGNEGALMELFPNVRGLIGLLAVMTGEGEGFNKTLDEIENSLGATGEAFKIMMETTDNQMAILKNNIMAKLKPLGDSILGFMNDLASEINISMSGATDEFSRMAKAYSDLSDTLQRKKNRIDSLITIIEDLKSKTELTKEETVNLEAAERSLMILLPDLGKAARNLGEDFDILTEAKRGSLELDIKIIESKLAIAEAEKKRTEIEIARFKRSEDEASKELKRLEEEIDFWYKEIERGGPRLIEEFYQAMRKFPFDDFTKQIDDIVTGSGKAGIVVRNLGERLRDIQKDMQMGIDTTAKQDKLREEIFVAAMNASEVYQEALEALDIVTGEVTIEEHKLNLELDESTIRINALTETLEKLKELREKPIVTPPKPEGEPPGVEPAIVPTITDKEIEDVKDKLTYMADQYKSYWRIVTQFGEEYVEEHNAQLAEDAKNYGEFLSNMLVEHGGIAELTKEIMLDIAEYNKEIIDKRKKAEEEYFSYVAKAREKELKIEEDRFRTIIKDYEEGSDEYLELVEQHNKNILEINEKYDKEIAEAKLVIFKEGLEKQIGELDKNYKLRLEIARAELGEETEAYKEYFEFINDKLQEIAETEEEEAKRKREILESYFGSYQTTEEKIVSIHKKTNELLLLTDIKYEKDKLKSIERQLIAEVRFDKAKQEIDDKSAEYGKELNNKELENFIGVVEEMKVKYSDFADIMILLNEEIAESQKQIWENINDEINKTVDILHNLAGVVGNFDMELEGMINDVADLVSGVGEITIGFAVGDIAGVLTGILGIINTIFNLFVIHKSDVPELRVELAEITLELQKQQTILSQAIGTAKVEAIQDMIDLLNEQIDTYNDMIKAEEEAYGQFLFITWDETDQEKIEEWLSAIESANAEIANLWQQYREILTGTTAESIADAIADGFIEGLDSAQVFADTFNDMMKKAIIDAFKRTIVTKYIENWYEQFALLAAGGLTAEEIEALTGTYQEMIEAAEAQWEALANILEEAGIELLEEVKKEGLTGAIAGITEETAGLLAGQFQAIRINTVEILSNMESIIIINARIADNTEYNKYLKDIDEKLSKVVLSESEYLRGVGGV